MLFRFARQPSDEHGAVEQYAPTDFACPKFTKRNPIFQTSYRDTEHFGGFLANLACPDVHGGERGSVVGCFGDIVEAHHGAVATHLEAEIGETDHHAECADVIVANDGRRVGWLAAYQLADRSLSLLTRWRAIDDAADQ